MLGANGHTGLRTTALRPFVIYGEGDRFYIGVLLNTRARFTGSYYFSACYIGNLVRWHLLADKGLETKPEVVGGQVYFVANDEEQTETIGELNNFLIDTLKVKFTLPVNTIFFVLGRIMPAIDRLVCGKFNGEIFSAGPGSSLYIAHEARFNIAKGVRDLGYTTRFDKEAIKGRLQKFYNVS